jgi:hypothetical protein
MDVIERQLAVLLFLFLWAGFPSRSFSLDVEILNAQHTTSLSLFRYNYPFDFTSTNFSRTQISSTPVSDSLNNPLTGSLAVEAHAELFGVHAFAPSPGGADSYVQTHSATATNEIWFSPLNSGSTSLTALFSAAGHWYDCSQGGLSLLDLTTGTELWNYQWTSLSGDVAGVPVVDLMYYPTIATNMLLSADFIAGDIYKLTLHTRVNAGNSPRSPTITLQLTGLDPISIVPEPSALAMGGLGILGGWVVRRRGLRK